MESLFSTVQMRILGSLTLFMVFLALASYASLNFETMKHLEGAPATISVTGEGEVLSVPDIGQFTFSVQAQSDTAKGAQDLSGETMNDILAYLRESGVVEADIKTINYNLYPRYRFEENICDGTNSLGYCPPGDRVVDGFDASQSVQVMVRDTEIAPGIISGVGERGATNISGLDFVIDDPDMLMDEARAAAITDAKERAGLLAEELGVRIVRFSGYYEDSAGYGEPALYQTRNVAFDLEEAAFSGAELPIGEEKIVSRVTVVYEVR